MPIKLYVSCIVAQEDIYTPFCPTCGDGRDHHPTREVRASMPPETTADHALRAAPVPARLAYVIADLLGHLGNALNSEFDPELVGHDDPYRELEGYLNGPTLTELINGLNECAQVWDRG